MQHEPHITLTALKDALTHATDDDRLRYGERLADMYWSEKERSEYWREQAKFWWGCTCVWMAVSFIAAIARVFHL